MATLAAHLHAHGPLPEHSGREIRALTAASGLTGHGGAGFPTYRKFEAVAGSVSSRAAAVVIANAAEGEPFSRKDRTLLTHAPHLVLDGLALAARAVGADTLHIYVPAASAHIVHAALAERPGHRVTVTIAPETFVAGEESAVVAAVAGKRPIPTTKGVRITERGLRGRPTLVQNIETLAHLALIARHGPQWYRSRGTEREPGTFLASISGPLHRPGVYEVPYGISLGGLLDAAGRNTRPLQAVLVGGYHGAWIPPDPTIEISRAGLARFGAAPGAGVIMPLPAGECGLLATAQIVSYLAGSSAGQCGPCANGLPRINDTFTALAGRTPRPDVVDELERLSRLVTGRGACKHPDGTARLVRSSLHRFGVPVKLLPYARQAVTACPRLALSLR